MSTKRSSLTLVSRETSPSTIKLLLLVSYGIVAMIGYGLGKVSEAAPAATCLSPLSAAAQPVCNCYCDGSHKARSSSSSLRVEEAEEEEQQQEGETPNETGGAEAPADEVAEPEWMVKARAVAQAQFVSGHRFKGTLIPSIEAIRAYSVEGAEPEPVVPFPESVPDVVKSLYRGVNGIVSPYSGFDASGWPQDLSGWNGEEASLPELVLQANASVVIEVGSWKGMSSVAIGKALQEVQQKGRLPAGVASPLLLCVDTWQGAPEFLENRLYGVDADRDMLTLHGWPLVFFQWLANMVHAGLTSVVFPLPASSLIAAEFLRRADGGFRADAIYIDGSHEEHDVSDDVQAWFPFLREDNPEAVMVGDDYPGWPGVQAAVNKLVETRCLPGTEVHLEGQKWWLYRRECPDLAAPRDPNPKPEGARRR